MSRGEPNAGTEPEPLDRLDDEAFLARFEAGTLPPAGFKHPEHVRAAWLMLRRYGPAGALERYPAALRLLAAAAGKPGLYHETITWAWLLLIHERMARGTAIADSEAAESGASAMVTRSKDERKVPGAGWDDDHSSGQIGAAGIGRLDGGGELGMAGEVVRTGIAGGGDRREPSRSDWPGDAGGHGSWGGSEPRGMSWELFRRANPDLFERGGPLLRRYYREETLSSALARRIFVLPDRLAAAGPRRSFLTE